MAHIIVDIRLVNNCGAFAISFHKFQLLNNATKYKCEYR